MMSSWPEATVSLFTVAVQSLNYQLVSRSINGEVKETSFSIAAQSQQSAGQTMYVIPTRMMFE
jgi:hypothetical protein